MIESKEEQDLSLEIDRDLQELHDCINNMRQCNSLVQGSFDSVPVNHREGIDIIIISLLFLVFIFYFL
jgi:hypothetical protein